LILLILVLAPLIAAAVVAAFGWRRPTAYAGVLSAGVLLVGGSLLAARVLAHDTVHGAGGLLRADPLSAFMVVVIGAVAVLADLFAIPYVAAQLEHGHMTVAGARSYGVLVQLFHAAMVLAVLAANLGVMWVAVEATTIATVFLVGHQRTRASLEASWKYLIIGSVGIALAFLGTVLLALAASRVSNAAAALDWVALRDVADRLDPSVVRMAVGLLVLGYGTKIGLAPMHTWLPDAHSQAPAPVSALMSGVLLSVAFHSLLRVKVIADAALGPQFMRMLLVTASLLTLAVSASMLLAQRDYKRMLAYSSVEHMGLIALGAAAGTPLAIGAVLLHILGHGLAKGVLFLASGEISTTEGTTSIAGVRGYLGRNPFVGTAFGVGLLALLGMPPFSLFTSELTMIRAEWGAGLAWAVAPQVFFLFVIFAAMANHCRHMLLGEPSPASTRVKRIAVPAGAALIGGLTACAFIGTSAWPLRTLLEAAATIVTPGAG
jgi:hydrogenase-4 component F